MVCHLVTAGDTVVITPAAAAAAGARTKTCFDHVYITTCIGLLLSDWLFRYLC